MLDSTRHSYYTFVVLAYNQARKNPWRHFWTPHEKISTPYDFQQQNWLLNTLSGYEEAMRRSGRICLMLDPASCLWYTLVKKKVFLDPFTTLTLTVTSKCIINDFFKHWRSNPKVVKRRNNNSSSSRKLGPHQKKNIAIKIFVAMTISECPAIFVVVKNLPKNNAT